MAETTKIPGILLLEDGTVCEGFSAGFIGTRSGELCFNTGMTGYQEIFTDPSYNGQIIVATHVHIGNYGIHKEEIESEKIQIEGLICRSFNDIHSRRDAHETLSEYFNRYKILAIADIDTRALVRHIRNKGAMNAIISSETTDLNKLKELLSLTPGMAGLELASKVSTIESYFYGDAVSKYKIAILDLGIKKNILRNLTQRNCYCKVFPAQTTFEEMEGWIPDGYFISNGPGDPSVMAYAVETIQKILNSSKPLFGICLGHQLLAIASGVSTYKMHHGHRGINHPVKNLMTGKCEVTSQNHGFGVNAEDILRFSDKIEVTHINLNDQSVEGIRLKNKKAFSVQYHPESSPGPDDSGYLFDDFITMLENHN